MKHLKIFGLACLLTLALAACQPGPVITLMPPTELPQATSLPKTALPPAPEPTRYPSPPASSPPATPTPASLYGPTPTVFVGLAVLQPNFLPVSLPTGLEMDFYKMTTQPVPEEIGYEEILRSLGGQSRVSRFNPGRYYWETADLALMEADNAALAPFGYRIVNKPVAEGTSLWFELYQGEKSVLDPITLLGPVSVNRSGTDFMLLVMDDHGFRLIQKASIQDWKTNSWIDNSRPQYLGDDPMRVEAAPEALPTTSQTPEPPGMIATVFKADQVVARIRYQDRPVASGFIFFQTYGLHWAVEVADRVVIDGQEVNTLKGYQKSYGFHLLGGKPLFFYEKAGALGINFNGEELALPFQTIPHYGCCSAGALNPVQIGNLLLFYGMKDGAWYYVEAAVKE